MKAVIQRVTYASVEVDQKIINSIKTGLLILLGVGIKDAFEDIKWLSNKISNLRIFEDENEVMNHSIKDIKGDAIVVSQFTLMANTKKGNRPSYIHAAKPEVSIPLYEQFVQQLENDLCKKVGTGIFGADMKIDLRNDGPVTIIIDTKNK